VVSPHLLVLLMLVVVQRKNELALVLQQRRTIAATAAAATMDYVLHGTGVNLHCVDKWGLLLLLLLLLPTSLLRARVASTPTSTTGPTAPMFQILSEIRPESSWGHHRGCVGLLQVHSLS
jgi:hypothetical protein